MPDMSVMTLSQARELLKLSQRELDRRAGVPEGTVREIETGKNKRPSYHNIVRIVRALQRSGMPGVTAEQLFPVPDTRPEAVAS